MDTSVPQKSKSTGEEKVFLNMFKEHGALSVYVKNGKIVRTEPFKGHTASSFQCSERYRVYSPQRLKYPMKRVGWEPGGKSSISNRGKGVFSRISWDEAFDVVEMELKRMLETYGPSAFLYAPGEHSDSWFYHNRYLFAHDFLSYLGGYTTLGCDGLSWAASRSSGASIAGFPGYRLGAEEVSHVLKYSKMVVFWSKDPLVTDAPRSIEEFIDDVHLMKEADIKLIWVSAALDESAKNFADKWIPCHPYGDEALAAAIAHTWITEGTYDQNYLDTHAVGFDESHLPADAPLGSSFKSYILGESDGTPKSPEWAEPICSVKTGIIRALAREWASKPTALMAWRGGRLNGGQYVRFMFTLMAMQGWGKPGVCFYETRDPPHLWRDGVKGYPLPHQWGERRFPSNNTSAIPFIPNVYSFYHVIPPELADMKAIRAGIPVAGRWPSLAISRVENSVKQVIRDVLFEASLNARLDRPIYHRYNIGMDSLLFQYPLPGHSEIHAYFAVGGNYLSRGPNSNSFARALLNPKIQFILGMSPWMEPDLMFADIILPTVTNFERSDVSTWRLYDIYCQKCIDNLGDAKSDREIWVELSKRMGIYEKFTSGMPTEDEWLRFIFNWTTLPKYYTWEEFKAKGYHEWKVPDDWRSEQPDRWKMRAFYENPDANRLITESGKIEIYSASTARISSLGQSGYYIHEDLNAVEKPNSGSDSLCPPIPKYIPNPEGKGTPLGERYPIAVMTCHPKYHYHTSYQNVKWLQDEERREVDGCLYAPIWMNRGDAEARGIQHGDIVRVFNHRGQILCWADVSDRIMPGAARVNYGMWSDFEQAGAPGSLDKSGNIENLCRGGFISPYDTQQDVQCVAQVEKWRRGL